MRLFLVNSRRILFTYKSVHNCHRHVIKRNFLATQYLANDKRIQKNMTGGIFEPFLEPTKK